MIAMQKPGVEGGEQLLLKGREPTLTPDGEWIVFASVSSAGYRLRRMRSDGTARVAISPGGSEERMPSVSPDGQFVAFVQLVNGYRKLAVRRFDGSREKVLLTDGWAEFPVW
jgi:TolB protein